MTWSEIFFSTIVKILIGILFATFNRNMAAPKNKKKGLSRSDYHSQDRI